MIRYYVTDRGQGDLMAFAGRAVRDGVDMIQVREKDLPGKELFELVCKIRDLAVGTKTAVLVNDRLDVALAAGVQGVHLPANSFLPSQVRPFVTLLGVSAHTIEEAVAAEESHADFIVFGPIFDTPGKYAVGLDPLRKVVTTVKIPVIAIGGVTAATTQQVLATGAGGIAGIRMFQND